MRAREMLALGTVMLAGSCRPTPLDSSSSDPGTSQRATTDAGSTSSDASAPARRDGAAAIDGAPPSSGPSACVSPDPSTVRLLLPQSASIVTSDRPRFVWTGAAGPYQLQVCADRACHTVLLQTATSANEMTVAQAVPPGYWFWRVRAMGASVPLWTSSWEMRVRRRFSGYAPMANTSVAGFSDYNGDGYPDVALLSAAPLIYLGGPDGLVADRVVPNVPNGPTPMGLIEPQTDVNGDGFTDVGSVGAVTVPGQSGPAYGPHVQFGASTGLSSLDPFVWAVNGVGNPVGLGDFNGDGYGDLAVQYRYGADLLLGCVSTTSWAGLFCDACQVQQLASGDFDGDGRSDIIFADGGNISLYMGNPSTATHRTIAGMSGLSVLDFNYDGFSDLVFPTGAGPSEAYEGGPDGLSSTLSTSFPPLAFSLVGDFDGDGYWDSIGASGPQLDPGDPPPTGVAYGGPGGWGAPPTRTTTVDHWATTSTAVVTDVNADGYDDLVVQDPRQTVMYWYAGSPSGLAPTPTGIIAH